MATRIYFPSAGTPVLPSLAYGSGWDKTSGAQRFLGVTTKTDSAIVTINTGTGTALTPEFVLGSQHQFPGLASQTFFVGGTLKGQCRAFENSAVLDGTLAIAARIVSSDGTVNRGDLIGPTPAAADATTTPPELGTSAISTANRKFMDSSESATISLAAVIASAGDILIVEIGVRNASTSTSAQGNIKVGDPVVSDLPEDETTTSDWAGWVEFSATIQFLSDVPALSWGNNSWDIVSILKRRFHRITTRMSRRDKF